MHEVVVYSRRGRHLCDVVKETLTRAQGKADFVLREVDIDHDAQLRQQYNDKYLSSSSMAARRSSTA